MQSIPHIKLLVIGRTGSGKTTFINGCVNQFYNMNYYGERRIAISQNFYLEDSSSNLIKVKMSNNMEQFQQKQSDGDNGQCNNQTQKCNIYPLERPNLKLSLIDSPGCGIQDKQNVANIVNGVKELSNFNSICLVHKGNDVRVDDVLSNLITELKGMLNKECENNFIICFTRVANQSKIDALEAMKTMNIPTENFVFFENNCLIHPHQIPNYDEGYGAMANTFWDLNQQNFNKLIEISSKLIPQKDIEIFSKIIPQKERVEKGVLAENKKSESCLKKFNRIFKKFIKPICCCCTILSICLIRFKSSSIKNNCINCCVLASKGSKCACLQCDIRNCCKCLFNNYKYCFREKCACCFDNHVHSPTKIVPLSYEEDTNNNRENERGKLLSDIITDDQNPNLESYQNNIEEKDIFKAFKKEIEIIDLKLTNDQVKFYFNHFQQFVINEKIFNHHQEINENVINDEYDVMIKEEDLIQGLETLKKNGFIEFIYQMCRNEEQKKILEQKINEMKPKEEKEDESFKTKYSYDKIIDAIMNDFMEHGNRMTSDQILSLFPIAYINNGQLNKKFLGAVLKNIKEEILFQPEKVNLLKNIVLYGKGCSNGLTDDDVLMCIKTVVEKIKLLTITNKNENIQVAMDSLCDLLYVSGSVLHMSGLSADKRQEIKNSISLLQQHRLERIFNDFTGKFSDPSLRIKHNYAIKALSFIGHTDYEKWAIYEHFVETHLLFFISTIASVFSGNPSAILHSMNGLKQAYHKILANVSSQSLQEIKQSYTKLMSMRAEQIIQISPNTNQFKNNFEPFHKPNNEKISRNNDEPKEINKNLEEKGVKCQSLKDMIFLYNKDQPNSDDKQNPNSKKNVNQQNQQNMNKIVPAFLNIEYVSKYPNVFKELFNIELDFLDDIKTYNTLKKDIKKLDENINKNIKLKKIVPLKLNKKEMVEKKNDLNTIINKIKTKIQDFMTKYPEKELMESYKKEKQKIADNFFLQNSNDERNKNAMKNLLLTNHRNLQWYDKVNILRSVESLEIHTIIQTIYRLNISNTEKNENFTYFCIKTLVNVITDLSRQMYEQIKAIYTLYGIYHFEKLGETSDGNEEYKVGTGAFDNTSDIKYYIRKQLGRIYVSLGPGKEYVKYVSYNILHRLCTYENDTKKIKIEDYLLNPFLFNRHKEIDSTLVITNAIRRLGGNPPFDPELYEILKKI